MFLIGFADKQVIVFVGGGIVFVYKNNQWVKPNEIGDYSIKEKSGFPSDVSHFFGRGELKGDSFYSAKPES